MDCGLKGKTAIVTGGSRGIGQAISISLAGEGVKVVVVARDMDAINETCSVIEKAGGEAIGFSVDVTSESGARDAVQMAVAKYGKLDILINNAGGAAKFGSFQECTLDDWLDSFRLNVLGCVNFAKAAEAELLRSGDGRIVTVSSISGVQPGHFNPHYSTTKAATINLSKHLANIYAGKGICSNVICAGPVHSDSWGQNVAQLAKRKSITFDDAFLELEKQEVKKIPLGRVGEPEDIAAMVVFLASEKAAWITGSCFHVSGGKFSSMS